MPSLQPRNPVNTPAAPSFINLDLELDAAFDLAPLAAYLRDRVFVLYCGETEHGFRLAFEPVIGARVCGDAAACTDYFLALAATLPPDLRGMWDRCTTRVFDYGFEGGREGSPCMTQLSAARLAAIAALGADVRTTVYPCGPSPAPGS